MVAVAAAAAKTEKYTLKNANEEVMSKQNDLHTVAKGYHVSYGCTQCTHIQKEREMPRCNRKKNYFVTCFICLFNRKN